MLIDEKLEGNETKCRLLREHCHEMNGARIVASVLFANI